MNVNKSIKQLADELRVSKTAVRKYLTEDFREKYTETDRNQVIRISPDGCKLIAETIENNRKPFVETTENKVSADVLSIPREVWDALQRQLNSQERQIEELTSALKQEQALHAGTIKNQALLPASAPPKKKFFSWFKKEQSDLSDKDKE